MAATACLPLLCTAGYGLTLSTAWGHLLPLRLVDPVEEVDEDLVDELALGDLEAHEVLQLREPDDDRRGGGEARDDRVREERDEEAEAQEACSGSGLGLGFAPVRVSAG